jgi:alginate O-acetyltransferase complex protein AlgI
MLFFQPVCLLLVFCTTALYFLIARGDIRQALLLAASMLFYVYAGFAHFLLLLALITVNFTVGLRLSGPRGRVLLALVVLLDAANLFLFKYLGFFLDSLHLFPGATAPAFWKDLALPAGISFYTFQLIAYQVDVWKRRIEPSRSLIEFSTFVMFFPQLLSGPIMRGSELLGQLRDLPTPRAEEVSSAAFRFLLGYLKKVVVVNHFLGPKVDGLFAAMPTLGAPEAWAAVFLFGFQLYLDFSGYCDMAIGIARVLGVNLRENFRTPYLAGSPAEFWNRWNITLSQWIRDYIYIPLGGSRRSSGRNALNLVLTMALCGLWHGAAWGFVFWGIYHGLLILAGRLAGLLAPATGQGGPVRAAATWAASFVLLQAGWAFFRVPDLKGLTVLAGRLFSPLTAPGLQQSAGLWLLVAALLALHVAEEAGLRWTGSLFRWWERVPALFRGAAYAALGVLLVPFSFSTVSVPFIYFQF